MNGIVFMWVRASGAPIAINGPSVALLLLVGVCAAFADLFSLYAYGAGLKVTSAFVIGGTAAVLVLLVGFLVLREPFTWTKLIAIGLIAGGMFLLQRTGL